MTCVTSDGDYRFYYQPIYLRAEAFCADYNRFCDWIKFLPKKVLSHLKPIPPICFTESGFVVFDFVRLTSYYDALCFELSKPKHRKFLRYRDMVADFNTLKFNSIITSKV